MSVSAQESQLNRDALYLVLARKWPCQTKAGVTSPLYRAPVPLFDQRRPCVQYVFSEAVVCYNGTTSFDSCNLASPPFPPLVPIKLRGALIPITRRSAGFQNHAKIMTRTVALLILDDIYKDDLCLSSYY